MHKSIINKLNHMIDEFIGPPDNDKKGILGLIERIKDLIELLLYALYVMVRLLFNRKGKFIQDKSEG